MPKRQKTLTKRQRARARDEEENAKRIESALAAPRILAYDFETPPLGSYAARDSAATLQYCENLLREFKEGHPALYSFFLPAELVHTQERIPPHLLKANYAELELQMCADAMMNSPAANPALRLDPYLEKALGTMGKASVGSR